MPANQVLEQARAEQWTDEQISGRVLAGEVELYELIMRRYNQRLYRITRAILRNDAEAEDAMQAAYLRAYERLGQFEGRAPLSAWLTKIAVHEALARRNYNQRTGELDAMFPSEADAVLKSKDESPEQQASNAEMRDLLERAILALPSEYRTIVMMRDIEEMSTAETALALEITQENVKVRLHRARALLRKELYSRAGESRREAFPFMGERCDRVVRNVLREISFRGYGPASTHFSVQ